MYEKILVPLDGSDLAEQVLPHVKSLVEGGAVKEVIFLRVVEPPPKSFAGGDYVISVEEEMEMMDRRQTDAQKYLDLIMDQHKSWAVNLSARVVEGRADESIVDFVTKQHANIVVMATHGRSGVSRWLMGSVADRVVRWSCVPVLLVRPEACVPKA